MVTKRWMISAAAGVMAVGALLNTWARADEEAAIEVAVEAVAAEQGEAGPQLIVRTRPVANTDAAPALHASRGKFWIGVACEPLSDILKVQLDRSQGLIVEDVIDDSPAAKAGVAKHDILLAIGGTSIGDIQQLIAVVDETGAQEVDVLVLRKGKEKTLRLSPAERPKDMIADLQNVEQDVIKQIERLKEHHKAMTMTVVRPGVMLPPGHVREWKLPDNVSISMEKQGDKPAKIRVQRDGKEWNVTEDKLEELPADLRGFVEQMRGQTIDFHMSTMPGAPGERKAIRVFSAPEFHEAVPGARMTVKPLPGSATPFGGPFPAPTVLPLEGAGQPLAELHKKMDQMLKAVQSPRDVEKLSDEVKRLRSDVDQLRKELDNRNR